MCTTCPEGYQCHSLTEKPIPCSLGEFSEVGNSTCSVCPGGYECPNGKIHQLFAALIPLFITSFVVGAILAVGGESLKQIPKKKLSWLQLLYKELVIGLDIGLHACMMLFFVSGERCVFKAVTDSFTQQFKFGEILLFLYIKLSSLLIFNSKLFATQALSQTQKNVSDPQLNRTGNLQILR